MMKQILFSLALGLVGAGGAAQGFTETFDYPAGSNVGGTCTATPCDNNNWSVISGSVVNDVPIAVVDGSLSYVGHFSPVGNKIQLPTTNGAETRDIARATGFAQASFSVAYYSFLLNVVDDSRLQESFTNQGNFIAGSNGGFTNGVPNGGGPLARVSIIKSGGGFKLGISNNQGNTYTEFPQVLDFGFTHLVIVKYTLNPGNDLAEMWVNPSGSGVDSDGDPLGGVSNTDGTATPANCVQVQIRTTSNGPNAYLDDIRIGTTISEVVPPVLLPVNFSAFEGSRGKAGVDLQWTTAQETDNRGFDIERSLDGTNFTKAGYVASRAANGSSAQPLSYNFSDVAAPAQQLYYRLKQIDFSGVAHYSKTIVVGAEQHEAFVAEFSMGNVIHSRLGLRLLSRTEGVATVRVMDSYGRVLMQQRNTYSTGSNYVEQNVSGLAAGTYMVQVSAEGFNKTLRFVKQ